jgi:hypothetical protein
MSKALSRVQLLFSAILHGGSKDVRVYESLWSPPLIVPEVMHRALLSVMEHLLHSDQVGMSVDTVVHSTAGRNIETGLPDSWAWIKTTKYICSAAGEQ